MGRFTPPKLRLAKCAADGDCMYHAIIISLKHIGIRAPPSQLSLRHQLTEYMRKLPQTATRIAAINRVKLGEWGQDFELQELSKLYRLCIFVYQSYATHSQKWQLILPSASMSVCSSRDRNSHCGSRQIYLLNRGQEGCGVHFDALLANTTNGVPSSKSSGTTS